MAGPHPQEPRTESRDLFAKLKTPDGEDAWTRFLELNLPRIYSFARRHGVPEDSAADIAQEVVIYIFVNINDIEYRSSDTFGAYLKSVTKTKVADFWRTRTRFPDAAGGTDHMAMIEARQDSHSNPTESRTAREIHIEEASNDLSYTRLTLEKAFDQIEGDFDRKTFLIAREALLNGRPAGEIAQEFGVPTGTVRVYKSRVKSKLSKLAEGPLGGRR